MPKKNKEKEKLSHPLYVHDKPKSVASERFRGIRSNIMFSGVEEANSIIVTSENQQQGKALFQLILQ